MNPFIAGILHDQRAQCEGEGNGCPHVAKIKHGRVNHHLGILQKRVETGAVGAKRAFEQPEGIGCDVYQSKKEDLHSGENDGGVSEEARISLVAKAEDEGVSGEQERPEHQRTFLP